jgi:ribonuclease J
MDINKHKDELLFVPLGGSGEIGLNFNLYHYKGKWIIVDFGAGFADDYLPGVDMIVPDISFIEKHKKDVLGIVLTHAHEDHLGAVQYLWDEIGCPVYTTRFTSSFLKAKLSEYGLSKKVPIVEIEQNGSFELGPFSIEYVQLAHSAPEMQAAIIRTDLGNVMHTGDWKFDHDPLVGKPADDKLLKKIGDEGILALVGDSTNVFNPGTSGSEGDLKKSMIKLISECDKLVVVTTFASNIARIDTIIRAAAEAGRKVVMAGRSLWRVTNAARETGYLENVEEFLDDRSFAKYPRNKILVLCTGCQGEPMAAATKMANGSHPTIKLVPGDNIIFSSKIIPGNDKRIYRQFNQLIKLGVNLFTEKSHFVHVSGHPSRDELKKMYELIRPKLAIPVHGEIVHIHEHAKMAKKWGVKQAICVENGDVIRLAPGKPEKIAVVPSGYLAVDGNYLLPTNSPVMKARRKLQHDGAVIVTLIMGHTSNTLRTDPILATPGSLDAKEDHDLIMELTNEIRFVIDEKAGDVKKIKIKIEKTSNEALISQVKSIVRRVIKREVGKEPLIEVHVERV